MNANVIDLSRTSSAPRVERNDHRVSSQWYHRPDDQRFTSLTDLYRTCKASADASRTVVVDTREVKMEAHQTDADNLLVKLPGLPDAKMSHWSFGQLSGLLSAPAGYLRRLPAPIAAINLQYALLNFRAENVKAYATQNGDFHLRALTGPDYGRIYDHEVVAAVQKIAGDGVTGRWRVPGIFGQALDQVTKENTTLYGSDRDCFMFLTDEQTPIVIGKTVNGDDDVVYRGFYVWNSEVGSRSFGIATFLFRTVCQNRIIWGQSDFQEITLRHSKLAPSRFYDQAAPALADYSRSDAGRIVAGIQAAKDAVVARSDDARSEFLQKRGFSAKQASAIMEAVVKEEGHAATSVWDFVQGITAVARELPHQDARVSLELEATKLLKKVA